MPVVHATLHFTLDDSGLCYFWFEIHKAWENCVVLCRTALGSGYEKISRVIWQCRCTDGSGLVRWPEIGEDLVVQVKAGCLCRIRTVCMLLVCMVWLRNQVTWWWMRYRLLMPVTRMTSVDSFSCYLACLASLHNKMLEDQDQKVWRLW